jgi:hypothetical protein
MFHAKDKVAQPEMWIPAAKVARPAKSAFYSKLDQTLDSFGFAEKVRSACVAAYDQSGAGRRGIDPVVYLKMMMVGFFENLPSERAIASRCADSIAIREFLHYELTEQTPEHSSLSIIRQRLEGPVYEEVLFETSELQTLQTEGVRIVICDPVVNRRMDKLEGEELKAVKAARRGAKSKYGKALLGRRGTRRERAFAHISDCGGLRRATLRGLENLNKRFNGSSVISEWQIAL